MQEVISFLMRVAVSVLIVLFIAWKRNDIQLNADNWVDKEVPIPVFGIFRHDCYDKLLNLQLLDDMTCWQFTLLKVTGYSIIVAAFLLKMP